MESKASKWLDPALMLLVGFITFGLCFLFAVRGVDPHHDGWMLKTAVDVSRGLTLFSQTYTQYGSLYVYLLALGVRLFGETIVAIQAMTCLAYAACGMLLYAIVRRFAGRLVAVCCPLTAIGLAAFYFWNFHPWSSVFVLMFSLAACLCLIRFTETVSNGSIALCGVFTACMVWCRQPAIVGMFVVLLFLLGLRLTGFGGGKKLGRALVWFLAGNLLVHAVLFGVIFLQGSFGDWWIQSIRNAFTFATEPTAETAAAQPDRLVDFFLIGVNQNPRYDWIWRVLTYGTLLYLLVLVVLAFRRKKQGGADAPLYGKIAFAAMALSGWSYYFPTLCYRHMIWADYPMVGVLGTALFSGLSLLFSKCGKSAGTAAGRRRALLSVLTCVIVVGLCASNLLVRARIGKSRLLGGGNGANFHLTEYAEDDTVHRYMRSDYGYLNGLYLSERETRFYDGLFDAVAAAQAAFPDKNIVNTTPNALFSVFTSDNVHPGAFDVKSDGYPEQTQLVQTYIETQRPILITTTLYEGYTVAAYLTDYNGDAFRYQPVYVLIPA